jgi:hypothetical protein
LTTDEVHVTKAGYEIMERMVKDAIDKNTASKLIEIQFKQIRMGI